jgi:predicted RNA-binding Zn-ribbon protein involved in translation (DUF1610 family)
MVGDIEKEITVTVDEGKRTNLIACPDCEREVSRRAASCPNCGCPIAPQTQTRKPRCPTCGSERVERIEAVDKVKSAIMFGVFSLGKLTKTYYCKNCKHKW